MAKNSEVVSRIKNQMSFLVKDQSIPDRFILNIARQISKTFISGKLREMSLSRESNLYKHATCISMEEIDPMLCDIFEFKRCESIMISKKEIPEIVYSKLGSSVIEVTDMAGEYQFKETTPTQYRRNKRRKSDSDQKYYYIKDNKIYLLDSNVKKINIRVLTLDLYDLQEICECEENCKSAWDYEFICPDKLLEPVIENTISQLGIKKQLLEDENPNLNSLG